MEQKGGEGKQGEASWQDFKKAGKRGQGVGALKRGGLEPPYELCTFADDNTLACFGKTIEELIGFLEKIKYN